jgi:hypothetical protein
MIRISNRQNDGLLREGREVDAGDGGNGGNGGKGAVLLMLILKSFPRGFCSKAKRLWPLWMTWSMDSVISGT